MCFYCKAETGNTLPRACRLNSKQEGKNPCLGGDLSFLPWKEEKKKTLQNVLRKLCVGGEKSWNLEKPLFHSIRRSCDYYKSFLKLELMPESYVRNKFRLESKQNPYFCLKGMVRKLLLGLPSACVSSATVSFCLAYHTFKLSSGLAMLMEEKLDSPQLNEGAQTKFCGRLFLIRGHILNWVSTDGLLHQCSQLQELKSQPNIFSSH